MGIDVKESCAIIWKVIGFSMSTSIKFMRNHPILSLVSMFLLALYILLPSLLFFLIYSSPVLACAVVYVREKLGLRFSGSSTSPKSCEGEKKGGRCHLRQQRSVRRNARMKVEEWDSQTSEEDQKDKVILTSLYNDLLGRTPQFEESPKAIESNVVEEENHEKSFGDEEDLKMSSRDFNVDQEQPMVCKCEVNEEKHDISKEEMSNGISEVERNKRLESLIARRRTRRLFKLALDQHNKLQAEETTSLTQNNNLHITVPRNNNNNSFEKRRSYQSGLQVPGSAPSVMLQARSPFDIPYDPQEERPILTGDSFDQEFSFFNPNDMFLSRHESFCRFAQFSPEHAQCMNSPVPASDVSTTRKLLDLDNEYMDHNRQNIPCYVKEVTIEDDDDKSSGKNKNSDGDMKNETDSSEDDDSSCSEESEAELNRFNKAELREAISHSMDNFPGFLVNQARNDIPSPLPRGLAAPRLDDNMMFYARRGASSHSRTFSIASDMQVEVSELGSPPTTVDWLDDWSNGGESYTYDTDIDREIIRGEESRKRVSQQCESRSKEDNNGIVTKPYQKCLSDEHLSTADEMSLLDRRSQTIEKFELRPSRSSDVPKSRSYGKLDGLLFHTSVSLSSITEEPETILESNIIDHQKKDQILNSIQGENEEHENTKPNEYETAQSILDASLDTPYVESFEREIKKEEKPNLNNYTKEVTQQESEVMEENGVELVKKFDENAKPMEEEKNHDVLEASLIHPSTQLSEEYGSEKHDSDVILQQVQDGNNSILDESTDQQFSKGESSEILKDLHAESTQKYNNIVNVEKESISLEDATNSQGSQPLAQQQGTDSSQGTQKTEHDDATSQNVVKDIECENTKPREYEPAQSVLDASLDTPCVKSFEREMKEEDEQNLDNFTKDITEQIEDKSLQGDSTSSPCHVFTNLQESEAMKENDPILVKISDKSAKLVEQEKTHDVLEASSIPPLVEDYENARNDHDVILLKAQDGNHSTLDESTDQKFSKERENSRLLKDHAEPTQEYNNIVNVKEELVGLEDDHDSQGSQQWTQQNGTKISEGISPRILDITQTPEHDDATISQYIAKDKVATEAKDSTDTEKNDEEHLKPDEQVIGDAEKKLQLASQSLHHNTGLTASEDDEESKNAVEVVNNSETKTTKMETYS